MALKNKGDNAGAAYTAQCGYTFDTYLQANKEYIIKFKAKSSSNAGKLQFQYQNGTNYGSQGGYNTFDIGSTWNTYEYEFITTYEDVNRIILNFGEVGGTYYIDDIEFGLKIDDTMTNILAGYSWGGSDNVRRAMAKKKLDVMEQESQEIQDEAIIDLGAAASELAEKGGAK